MLQTPLVGLVEVEVVLHVLYAVLFGAAEVVGADGVARHGNYERAGNALDVSVGAGGLDGTYGAVDVAAHDAQLADALTPVDWSDVDGKMAVFGEGDVDGEQALEVIVAEGGALLVAMNASSAKYDEVACVPVDVAVIQCGAFHYAACHVGWMNAEENRGGAERLLHAEIHVCVYFLHGVAR